MNYLHKALAAIVATMAACAIAASPAAATIEITDAQTGEICGDPIVNNGQVSGGCELVAEAHENIIFTFPATWGYCDTWGGLPGSLSSSISLHVGTNGEILSDLQERSSQCSPTISSCDWDEVREGQIRETANGLEADLEMCISPTYDLQGTVTFELTGEQGYEGYVGPSWTFTADNAPIGAYAGLTGAWVTEPAPGGNGAFLAVY